jgi:hypothetical protein
LIFVTYRRWHQAPHHHVRKGILTCFLAALGLLPRSQLAAAQAVPPVGTVISEANVSTVSERISP